MTAERGLRPAPLPVPSHAPNQAQVLVVPLGCPARLGTILQPSCSSPGQGGAGGRRVTGPHALPNAPRCSCRITIPVQSFSNLQIRGEAVATREAGGAGWWHKQGWLLGAAWEEMPSQPSLPHPEGPGGFPPNLKEPGLLGSPKTGGGVCHGHIPKAEHVPKANDIAKTDHTTMSPVPTTSPRPVISQGQLCSPVPTVSPRTTLSPSPITSQSHPCPHDQPHLQGPQYQLCPQG